MRAIPRAVAQEPGPGICEVAALDRQISSLPGADSSAERGVGCFHLIGGAMITTVSAPANGELPRRPATLTENFDDHSRDSSGLKAGHLHLTS